MNNLKELVNEMVNKPLLTGAHESAHIEKQKEITEDELKIWRETRLQEIYEHNRRIALHILKTK
jgi:hypothetical protein